MLELLPAGGMDIIRAMRPLVPPARRTTPIWTRDLRAFFDFNSMHMEPWDGPRRHRDVLPGAAARNLDCNGLRPARYASLPKTS